MFIVIDDSSGDFISAEDISKVVACFDGSLIYLKSTEDALASKLNPHEILKRCSIARLSQAA